MDTRPIIAVADATGLLGGAVARALLDDLPRRFRLRALVRHPHSSGAAALARRGGEVVATDLDDSNSVLQGLRGALGFFAVTDFWEHGSPERELAQARAMSTAARLADVEHVIWSTQEDSRRWLALSDRRMPTLLQRYKVPSFDAKGEADAFFAASGVPVTLLRTALPWQHLLSVGLGPRRAEDGALRLALPLGGALLPTIALADIGASVLALFTLGTPPAPRTVGIAAEHLSGMAMAATFARALGESVVYDAVPFDRWRALGIPGAEELGNQFQFIHDFNAIYTANRPIEATRQLYPALQSLEYWLARHRAHIPAV